MSMHLEIFPGKIP